MSVVRICVWPAVPLPVQVTPLLEAAWIPGPVYDPGLLKVDKFVSVSEPVVSGT